MNIYHLFLITDSNPDCRRGEAAVVNSGEGHCEEASADEAIQRLK
jgi:hypothetical protein